VLRTAIRLRLAVALGSFLPRFAVVELAYTADTPFAAVVPE